MKRALAFAAVLSSLASCAEGGTTATLDPESPAPPGEVFDEAGAPPAERPECTEETQQIYVVATDKGLYRFYPQTLKFVHVGRLGCPTNAGTFSMAIDRRGTAWVEYTDGRIFEVDTNDAKCKPTAFQPGQTGFQNFGMGYAKNGDDPASGETLYVSGAGLASLDTKTFQLTFLGSLSFGRTELTGMGSSLFAYSVGSGVVVGLDKSNAATKSVHRTSAIDEWGGFAFAHWGGEFWIFTGRTTSTVTVYSPSKDTSTIAIENTGMLIVGAGSSTCAPLEHPR